METKNVIAAIALSSAVIVLYSLFFIPEKSITNENIHTNRKTIENCFKNKFLFISPSFLILDPKPIFPNDKIYVGQSL